MILIGLILGLLAAGGLVTCLHLNRAPEAFENEAGFCLGTPTAETRPDLRGSRSAAKARALAWENPRGGIRRLAALRTHQVH